MNRAEAIEASALLLLFVNLNSTVPLYADDFKLTKYNFLFRTLTVLGLNKCYFCKKV